ncbi:MAG: peptidyl-prolyl cis-trans isomerase, partial [Candidatus Dependentiae bacterium]|nr:peptidyl-prolyl cis-trans isomerase [Candidatus Dependentiae bacterium]
MISAIRKSFGKRFTRIILWLAVISLAGLTSITGLFKRFSGMPSTTVADVGGYEISLTAFKRKAFEEERIINAYKKQFGAYAPFALQMMGMSTNPYENALQALLQEKLLLYAADKLSLSLSPEYVTRKLNDPSFALQVFGDMIPPYLYDALGGLDTQMLLKYLQRQGMTLDQFEQALENGLRRLMVMELMAGSIYVPQATLNHLYIQDFVKRTYGIATFSLETYEKQIEKKELSLEQLKSFFESQNAQTKKYWAPETRSGSVWTFDSVDYQLPLTDQEVAAYYNLHKKEYIDKSEEVIIRRILVQDEKKAQELVAELVQYPTRFAQIAQQDGNKTEKVTRQSEHPEEIKQAAFALPKDGAISSVIKTDKGFQIIGRVSKKEATYKPLESIKDSIKKQLAQEKFTKVFTADIQRLSSADSATLKDFVAKKHGQEKELKEQKKGTSKEIDLLFETQPQKIHGVVVGTKGYLVQLTQINPSHPVEFAQVEKEVQADYKREAALALLKQDMDQARQQVKSGSKSLKEVAQSLNAAYSVFSLENKQDNQWEKLTQQNYPVYYMKDMTVKGSLALQLDPTKGYLVELQAVAAITPEELKNKRAELLEQARPQELQVVGGSFIASLQKKVKINV